MDDLKLLLNIVNLGLLTFMGWFLAGVMKKLDTLWDSHNEKKSESEKLEKLEKTISENEKVFIVFKEKTEAHFEKTFSMMNELKTQFAHKENNATQGFNNLSKALERIEEKLKK